MFPILFLLIIFFGFVDYCDLDKDRGPCRNYTVWWYFDMAYGGCSRFWYGGCDGNKNRFKTKEECQGTCVEPAQEGMNLLYWGITMIQFLFQIGANYRKYLDHVKGTTHNGFMMARGRSAVNLFMVVVWAITIGSKHVRSVRVSVSKMTVLVRSLYILRNF